MPAAYLCPLRPTSNESEGAAVAEGWDRIEDADVLPEPNVRLPDVDDKDDETAAEDGSAVQVPVAVPAPPQPSREEVARHNLTHINYRSWCPHCVFGRRNNTAHRSQTSSNRRVPLFCADYCFVRDVEDTENLTCLVGRLYPNKAVFATACDQKGADDEAVSRLAQFLKAAGIPKLVYKSDQESSIRAAIEEALRRIGRTGESEAVEAVPESSAVGESASNGRAERTVQAFEDLLRTLKSALETIIQQKLPVQHATMKWLIEHTASVLTRYVVNDDGVTPYQAMHGKRTTLKIVEFAEQVFYHVPKRLRAKLTQRWRLGTYLGLAPSSNEHYVATKQGNVVKSRSICRVVERSRWSASAALGVIGTPSRMCPIGSEDITDAVEESASPHAGLDSEVREELEGAEDAADDVHRNIHVCITEQDLRLRGYSERCPRCKELQRGQRNTAKHHSDECRLRIYQAWKDTEDKKYTKIRHLLEGDVEEPIPGDVDLKGLRHDGPKGTPTPTGPHQPLTPADRPWPPEPSRTAPTYGSWDPRIP